MHQTVARAEEVHEGAEIDDLDHLAAIDHAHLGLGDDAADPFDRLVGGPGIDRRDLDRAVILDVDLGAGHLADLADHLASGADDLADLVLRDGQGGDPGRVLAYPLARARQRNVHSVEDVEPPIARLAQRDLHDFLGDPGDLDVHLQGRDPVAGAGDLEVHVAQMVLVAEDVGEDGETVTVLDQPHGDPGDRRLDRDTGIHHRQRGAADGGHRGGSVGLGDLRDHADGVGKVVLRRHHRAHRAPGELAVADLAPPGGAQETRLAHRIGREVVMQHEMLAIFAIESVDDLLVLAGAERRRHQGLGLAAGEQRAAVQPRQDSDLGLDRPDGAGIAAVDAFAGIQNGVADDVLLDRLEGGGDGVGGMGLGERLPRRRLGLGELLDPRLLDPLGIGLAQPGLGEPAHLLLDPGLRRIGRLQVPGLLGAVLGERDDRLDHRTALPLGEHHRAQHLRLGQRLRFGFDHQHRIGGAGDHHVEGRVLKLVHARVEHILAADVADPGAGDRTEEGDAGDGQRRRGSDQSRDVRVVFEIVAQDRADDLCLVAETAREERADRPVDQPRGQRFLLRRAAFALEEAARDASGREGLFLVVDRKRKEIDALPGLLLRHRGTEHGGFAIGHEHGAVRLAGDPACLDDQRTAAPGQFLPVNRKHSFILPDGAPPFATRHACVFETKSSGIRRKRTAPRRRCAAVSVRRLSPV